MFYKFFQKPTANPLTILKYSAIAWNNKRSIQAQELIRVMMNTSELLSICDRVELINNFEKRLKGSGYNYAQIWEIVSAGLKGYQSKVDKKNTIPIHRLASSAIQTRLTSRLIGKSNWFRLPRKGAPRKPGPGGRGPPVSKSIKFSTVLFTPRTHSGTLATRLKERKKELHHLTQHTIKVKEEGEANWNTS